MKKSMGWAAVFTGIVCAGSTMALGEVHYLDASRGVTAAGTVVPVVSPQQDGNDAKTSSTLGSFDQTATVDLRVTEQLPTYGGGTVPSTGSAFAQAWQQSDLNVGSIIETGRLNFTTSESDSAWTTASAASNLLVRFSIDTPHDFLVRMVGGIPGETAKLVCAADGTVYDFSLTREGDGLLQPGVYPFEHALDFGGYRGGTSPVDFGTYLYFSPREGASAATVDATVPEPATAALVSGAAVVLGLRRRRRA